MASGIRLGESLIWEYGAKVRIEKGYAVETDVNWRALTNDDGTPMYLWRCYILTPADDWNDELKVGKHPLNGHDTSTPEFWVEVGRGSEDEMDKLAMKKAKELKGASNGR
jgi:hypothetical protein